MLCYPIISEEKEVLHGVVEVINKVVSNENSENNVFTSSDKEVSFRIKVLKILNFEKRTSFFILRT